jgi:hypothetical protein
MLFITNLINDLLVIQPSVASKMPACFNDLFFDPIWLFRLPALALLGGVAFISFWLKNTTAKIAAAKAAAAAAASKKTQ